MKRQVSVLVVCEDANDAGLLRELLENELEDIHLVVERSTSAQQIHGHAPDVLVLAFRKLAAAEEFYLGFYRRSEGTGVGRHGTIVLCTREEVRNAYRLCRRGLFDDYVVFWPGSTDVTRLAMAAHAVLRRLELQESRPDGVQSGVTDRGARRERARVLVVDDDPAQHRLIGRLLDQSGMELGFASGGVEALRSIAQSPPELVLLDLRMPALDGVEVLRRLRALPGASELPVILVTGSADRESVRTTLEFGVVDFLVKPFDRETLVAKVRRALGEAGPMAQEEIPAEPLATGP